MCKLTSDTCGSFHYSLTARRLTLYRSDACQNVFQLEPGSTVPRREFRDTGSVWLLLRPYEN